MHTFCYTHISMSIQAYQDSCVIPVGVLLKNGPSSKEGCYVDKTENKRLNDAT